MTMNDHIEALVALVEELVKAGDYIHDDKDCHQDCPWVSARGDAVAYLKEECQTKHAPPILAGWVQRLEIFDQAKGKWWVRWTGADGIYRWLHPDTMQWIEEPHQISMPMFATRLEAEKAAGESPMPPTWEEYAKQA